MTPRKPSPDRPIDVTVVMLGRALPSTSIAPIEIFSCAGTLWQELRGEPPAPRFRVRTVTIDGKPTHPFMPLTMQAQGSIKDVRRTDLIVISASGLDPRSPVENAPLVPWLRRWHARGATLAGVCSGVSILAETGLLDGKIATTHWALADRFRQSYPKIRWQAERFITQAGRVFCGGGVYSAIDLSLFLVEKYCGHETAVETAKALLLDTPRVWQSGYAMAPPRSSHDDEGIRKAQAFLMRSFKDEVRVEELAARVGMSPRNFARRFLSATGETPLAYLHRLRIDAARHLLEAGKLGVAEVSEAVGYRDLAFFRRLFRRHAGEPPRAYRTRFGPKPPPAAARAA